MGQPYEDIFTVQQGMWAVATLGMLESLGKILEGILSTQLPSTVIF
jgi:hypothetical protein